MRSLNVKASIKIEAMAINIPGIDQVDGQVHHDGAAKEMACGVRNICVVGLWHVHR